MTRENSIILILVYLRISLPHCLPFDLHKWNWTCILDVQIWCCWPDQAGVVQISQPAVFPGYWRLSNEQCWESGESKSAPPRAFVWYGQAVGCQRRVFAWTLARLCKGTRKQWRWKEACKSEISFRWLRSLSLLFHTWQSCGFYGRFFSNLTWHWSRLVMISKCTSWLNKRLGLTLRVCRSFWPFWRNLLEKCNVPILNALDNVSQFMVQC